MKIKTPNIFITTSYDVISDIITKSRLQRFPNTLKDFQNSKDCIIVSPEFNDSLIYFEHSNGYDSKGEQIKLSFLETTDIVEFFLINKTSADKLVEEIIRRTDTKIENFESQPKATFTPSLGYRGRILSPGIDSVIPKTRNEIFGDELLTTDPSYLRTFYFSYGIGDDFSTYAGPFAMELIYTSHVITDGIRQVELVFNVNSGAFTSSEYQRQMATRAEGMTNKFNALNLMDQYKPEITVAELIDNPYSAANKGGRDIYISNFLKDNNKISSSVSNLLKKYIKAAIPDSEVIVILPKVLNIEEYFRKKKVRRGEDLTGLIWSQFSVIGRVNQKKISVTVPKPKSIKEYFNSMGIMTEYAAADIKSLSNADALAEYDSYSPSGFKLKLSSNVHAEDSTLYPTVDFYAPLDNFSTKLKDSCKGVYYPELNSSGNQFDDFLDYYDLDIIYENNAKIIELWKEYRFIPYTSRTKSVILFGSKKYINQILYLNSSRSYSDKNSIIFDTPNTDFILDSTYKSFYNTEYRKKLYNYLYNLPLLSSFESDLDFDSDQSLSDPQKSAIKDLNIPLFKFGTSNSNILGLELESNPALMEAFNYTMSIKSSSLISSQLTSLRNEKEIDEDIKKLVNILTQKVRDQIQNTSQTVESYYSAINNVLEDQELLKIIADKNKVSLNTNIDINNPNSYGDLVREFDKLTGIKDKNRDTTFTLNKELLSTLILINLIEELGQKDGATRDKPFIVVDSINDAKLLKESMFRKLQSMHTILRLKCLPFFGVVGQNIIANKRCVVLGTEPTIINSHKENKTPFYTGIYVIMAYKHVISNNELYSEFQLQKELYAENLQPSYTINDKNITIDTILNNKILDIGEKRNKNLIIPQRFGPG